MGRLPGRVFDSVFRMLTSAGKTFSRKLARLHEICCSVRKAESEDLGWWAPAWLFPSLLARKNALIDHRSLLPSPPLCQKQPPSPSFLSSFYSTLSLSPTAFAPRESFWVATEAESLSPSAWKTSRTNLIFQST